MLIIGIPFSRQCGIVDECIHNLCLLLLKMEPYVSHRARLRITISRDLLATYVLDNIVEYCVLKLYNHILTCNRPFPLWSVTETLHPNKRRAHTSSSMCFSGLTSSGYSSTPSWIVTRRLVLSRPSCVVISNRFASCRGTEEIHTSTRKWSLRAQGSCPIE